MYMKIGFSVEFQFRVINLGVISLLTEVETRVQVSPRDIIKGESKWLKAEL